MLRVTSSVASGERAGELSSAPKPNWHYVQYTVRYSDSECQVRVPNSSIERQPYLADEGQCIAITVFEITE